MTAHPAARTLIGIPWVEGGRDFRPLEGGADCLGIVIEFARRAGINARDPWEDVREGWGDGQRVDELVPPGWRRVDGEARQVGDVGETVDRAHVVAWAGDGLVLHSISGGVGSVLVPASRVRCRAWLRWEGAR